MCLKVQQDVSKEFLFLLSYLINFCFIWNDLFLTLNTKIETTSHLCHKSLRSGLLASILNPLHSVSLHSWQSSHRKMLIGPCPFSAQNTLMVEIKILLVSRICCVVLTPFPHTLHLIVIQLHSLSRCCHWDFEFLVPSSRTALYSNGSLYS